MKRSVLNSIASITPVMLFFFILGASLLSDMTVLANPAYILSFTDTIVIKQKDTTITYIPRFNSNKADSVPLTKKDPIVDFFNKQATKGNFNKWISGLIVSNGRNSNEKISIDVVDQYETLSQKWIKSIYFKQLEPFGPSINDTISPPLNWLEKGGNRVRVSTSRNILNNNLSFKVGDQVDPLKIIESERVLRQLGYISDAKIIVNTNQLDTNFVDIIVISQDQFPHAFELGLNSSNPVVTLLSKNLFGQGLGLSQSFTIASPTIPVYGFESNINVQSIHGSQIDLDINYTDRTEKHEIYFGANRSFYRSDIRNAGGIVINRSYKNKQISGVEQIQWTTPLNYFLSNVWIGHSFPITSKNYFDQSHYYLAFQNINNEFFELPDSLVNQANMVKNNFFFGAISFSKRNYYKNNLIHSFGRTEDVPYGFLASLTLGYNYAELRRRPYIGMHLSIGKALIPNKGYLYFGLNASSFFNHGSPEQGEVQVAGSFISKLINTGNSKMRAFVDIYFLKGYKRLPYENIYLNESRNGLSAFESPLVKGQEKLMIKTENVFFLPSRVVGFQFAFFTFADLGIIGDGKHGLLSQDYYLSLGTGLRIRNDKLVFNTLQLRFAFIPIVPMGMSPVNFQVTGESNSEFHDFVSGAPYEPNFK